MFSETLLRQRDSYDKDILCWRFEQKTVWDTVYSLDWFLQVKYVWVQILNLLCGVWVNSKVLATCSNMVIKWRPMFTRGSSTSSTFIDFTFILVHKTVSLVSHIGSHPLQKDLKGLSTGHQYLLYLCLSPYLTELCNEGISHPCWTQKKDSEGAVADCQDLHTPFAFCWRIVAQEAGSYRFRTRMTPEMARFNLVRLKTFMQHFSHVFWTQISVLWPEKLIWVSG